MAHRVFLACFMMIERPTRQCKIIHPGQNSVIIHFCISMVCDGLGVKSFEAFPFFLFPLDVCMGHI